jgi:hypothetical protein
MNFFGHAFVASLYSEDHGFVLGAMLPDFAAMLRARLLDSRHRGISSGIAFHLQTDQVFHRSSSFQKECRSAVEWLTQNGMRRGSARGVAHVGVELLLDSEISRRPSAHQSYLNALAAGSGPKLGCHIRWHAESDGARFEELRLALSRHGTDIVPTPLRVAARIGRALSRRPRLALLESERAVVVAWVEHAAPRFANGAQAMLGELEQGLSNTR